MKHSRNQIVLAFLLAVTLCCSLVGCGATKAYDSTQSDDKVARLLAHGVRFQSVNGVPISAFASSVLVLPGPNVIKLQTEPGNYTARDVDNSEKTIEFTAEENTTYAITGQRGDGRLCAFPYGKESGKIDFTRPAGCLKARSNAWAPAPPS